jgi:hypothetical protein
VGACRYRRSRPTLRTHKSAKNKNIFFFQVRKLARKFRRGASRDPQCDRFLFPCQRRVPSSCILLKVSKKPTLDPFSSPALFLLEARFVFFRSRRVWPLYGIFPTPHTIFQYSISQNDPKPDSNMPNRSRSRRNDFFFFFSLCDKRSLDLENELFWTPINFVPLLIDTTHQIDQFSIETNYPPFFLPPFWTLRPFFLDLPPSRTFFLPTSPAPPSHISRCILKPIPIFNNITIEYRHSYSLLLSDAESRFLDPCWPLKN